MESLINIALLNSDEAGRNDLQFDFPGLLDQRKFDSYYFALSVEPKEGRKEILNAVRLLIESWKSEVQKLKPKKVIYLPIDFSDQ